MSSDEARKSEAWVLRQARCFGFGRNPLRRPTDRFESGVVLLAVLAGLLMVPVGAAVGTAVRRTSEHDAAQQRSVLHQVQATTIEAAPMTLDEAGGQMTSRVGVAWQEPGGIPQQGRTEVGLGTKAHAEVSIWLDSSGQIAAAPRPAGDSVAIGGAVGLTTVIGSWLLLWVLILAARRVLDKGRLRAWAYEWDLVGPRWSRPQS